MRRPLGLILCLLIAGCADPGASVSAGPSVIAFGAPVDLPPPVGNLGPGARGPNGGIIFDPISAPVDEGLTYRFSLGHCGLHSPVDVDGSFWDAVSLVARDGGQRDLESEVEMINATSGEIVILGELAVFRTQSGSIVTFRRHAGAKEFPPCA